PGEAALGLDLARTCNNLGRVQKGVGDTRAALETVARARELAEGLVRDFPQEPSYRIQLARTYHNQGDLFKMVGNTAEKDRLCNQAVDVLEGLDEGLREGSEYQQTLADAYEEQALRQPFTQAQQTMSRAVAIQEWLAREQPADRGRQRQLGLTYFSQAMDERN